MARILLVDDDKEIRALGIVVLNDAGHETFTAPGVLQAIEFLRTHPVDLVITDANMPQHSGYDLVRTLKKDPRWKDLTIAMLTGRREKKDIERALELGVHDYIVKPLDPALLVQKVADLISKRPSKEHDEVKFAQGKITMAATVSIDVILVSISEIGIVFQSPQPFAEGTRIEIGGEIFKKIDIDPPILRVQNSFQKAGVWETRLIFVGAEERVLAKVRSWVHNNTIRGRKVA